MVSLFCLRYKKKLNQKTASSPLSSLEKADEDYEQHGFKIKKIRWVDLNFFFLIQAFVFNIIQREDFTVHHLFRPDVTLDDGGSLKSNY